MGEFLKQSTDNSVEQDNQGETPLNDTSILEEMPDDFYEYRKRIEGQNPRVEPDYDAHKRGNENKIPEEDTPHAEDLGDKTVEELLNL